MNAAFLTLQLTKISEAIGQLEATGLALTATWERQVGPIEDHFPDTISESAKEAREAIAAISQEIPDLEFTVNKPHPKLG